MIATSIGVYRIIAKLGAGGMGEVYRARDIRLDRDVAVKILPDSFAHDAERVARFGREAKVLVAMHHLNIAQIYGLEERVPVTEPVDTREIIGPAGLTFSSGIKTLIPGTQARFITATAKSTDFKAHQQPKQY